jgi:hypothetical protein
MPYMIRYTYLQQGEISDFPCNPAALPFMVKRKTMAYLDGRRALHCHEVSWLRELRE